MAADAADEYGFELPPHTSDVTDLVRAESRAKVIEPHNPLDLGDLFKLPLYLTLSRKTLERPDIDGLLFIHNYQGVFDAEESRDLIRSLGELLPTCGKPVAVCVFTTESELQVNRKAVRFPIFTDPREAVRALAWNRDYHSSRPVPLGSRRPSGVDPDRCRAELSECDEGPMPPHKLARVLAAYGIPVVPWAHAMNEEEAARAAETLGYPVVMKTAQPEVIHKSDVGAVVMDISDERSLREAYARLASLGPAVLLQHMAKPGLEWFVGCGQDRSFGPVLVTGPGGIFVELMGETALRVGPVEEREAGRMLDQLRGVALLAGARGQPVLDRQALTDVLVRVSWLLADFAEIRELDLNPVRVYGDSCLALDWRAVLER